MKKIAVILAVAAVFSAIAVLPTSAQMSADTERAKPQQEQIKNIQDQIAKILEQINALKAVPALQDAAKVAPPQEPPKAPPVSETTLPVPPKPGTSESFPPPRKPVTPDFATVGGNCMQRAVMTRDTSIINAATYYSEAVKGALKDRLDALYLAWGKDDKDERKEARRAAWEKFFETKHGARGAYLKEVKATWDGFRRDRINCQEPPTGEDPELDNQL